jgi:AraC family transcriptional regulator, positive regulator of tynA and feaB
LTSLSADVSCSPIRAGNLQTRRQLPLAALGCAMEWSAKLFRNDQPFGSWAEDLAAAFVQLEPRKIAEQPFRGTISRIDVAPIKVSRVEATKHKVLRLRSHIARSSDDVCFINLQLEGLACYTQRDHEQICGPGDLAVVETTEPFEIANCRNFKLFCFAVPRYLLPGNFSERPRLRLSATDTGRALSRTLAGYAELCIRSQRASEISAIGGTHIVDLISHATAVLGERPSERASVPVLLSMMLDYIDRHSDDPEVGAATLALKFHCSPRYVHKLFATTGRSVGEHINDKRILVCSRNLLDRNFQKKTIAEIAFTAGFRDISHFNRLFKRSNGAAPREFRRAMTAQTVTGAR